MSSFGLPQNVQILHFKIDSEIMIYGQCLRLQRPFLPLAFLLLYCCVWEVSGRQPLGSGCVATSQRQRWWDSLKNNATRAFKSKNLLKNLL